MGFARHCRVELLLLMQPVLTLDFRINGRLLVVHQPLLLLLAGLLQHDIRLSVRVDVFEEIDPCLVLSAPLLLTSLPLLSVLLGNEVIDHLLIGCFVLLPLAVV